MLVRGRKCGLGTQTKTWMKAGSQLRLTSGITHIKRQILGKIQLFLFPTDPRKDT